MNMNRNEINPEIQKAMEDINRKHKDAIKDTSRPKYHFASPAKMLIDVWGGIYHNDKYHLFYDINHLVDEERQGGSFGHICSKDLMNWENLPLALLPQYEVGENHLNDGCIVIDPSGKPLMYYTRCFEDMTKNREHIAVRGTDDLINWDRIEGSAITMENHGGPIFHMIWSDPLIFCEDGRTFMIISKCTIPDKGDMIPIYEAVDDTLLKWEYRGVFAEHTGEVLNFIKIRDKWVLIYSPYNNPKYFVGTFDVNTYKFTAEKEGVLSYGYVNQGILTGISRGFYATSAFYGEDKQAYIMGWISGFFDPKDWEGCVSLPRVLDIDSDNNLLMKPAPQLDKLRQNKIILSKDGTADCGRCFEIDAEFQFQKDSVITLSVDDSFKLTVTKEKIIFNDIEFDYCVNDIFKLRMFIDVTVAEIFFDDGRISVTRCFKELSSKAQLNVNACAEVNKFDIYRESNLYE